MLSARGLSLGFSPSARLAGSRCVDRRGDRPSRRAEGLTDDRLLVPERLIEIAIELPENDWRELCKQTRDIRRAFTGGISEDPFTYFKGNITIDGVKIESVGIRKKGFIGSLDDRFPSLKVKFDQYEKQRPVAGIDVLTLNNNKQDPALVSQFLTYHLFNAAGVHAPRANFARVTVNGEYLGIYSNVESIGKPFLERRFGNHAGNLYEGTLADFHPSAITRIEAKSEKSDRDRGDLVRLAKCLPDPRSWSWARSNNSWTSTTLCASGWSKA